MEEDRTLLALIGDLYDAALDEAKWPLLASKIAAAFSGSSCALQTRAIPDGGATLLSTTDNFDLPFLRSYQEHYFRHDQWVIRGSAMGIGKAWLSQDLLADSELMRSEYYDWLRMIGVFYLNGALFKVAENEVGIVGIHKERRNGPFELVDKQRLQTFLPHLQRTLQIRRAFQEAALERDTAFDGLDRLGVAAVVADSSGRILFANAGAEALLVDADAVSALGGRLIARTTHATERLHGLIRQVADTATGQGGSAGGYLSLPRRDRRPLTALVCPFRPPTGGNKRPSIPAALVFVRDPTARHSRPEQALRELFGLSGAEASLAAALSAGKTIDEFAEARGIRYQTARTQLRSVMAKTHTRRQGELVALVLKSAAELGS